MTKIPLSVGGEYAGTLILSTSGCFLDVSVLDKEGAVGSLIPVDNEEVLNKALDERQVEGEYRTLLIEAINQHKTHLN